MDGMLYSAVEAPRSVDKRVKTVEKREEDVEFSTSTIPIYGISCKLLPHIWEGGEEERFAVQNDPLFLPT